MEVDGCCYFFPPVSGRSVPFIFLFFVAALSVSTVFMFHSVICSCRYWCNKGGTGKLSKELNHAAGHRVLSPWRLCTVISMATRYLGWQRVSAGCQGCLLASALLVLELWKSSPLARPMLSVCVCVTPTLSWKNGMLANSLQEL